MNNQEFYTYAKTLIPGGTQDAFISSTVGYHSEAAFFQVFRKHYGTSPRQYRLQKRNPTP